MFDFEFLIFLLLLKKFFNKKKYEINFLEKNSSKEYTFHTKVRLNKFNITHSRIDSKI
jgi:hypothetical protein